MVKDNVQFILEKAMEYLNREIVRLSISKPVKPIVPSWYRPSCSCVACRRFRSAVCKKCWDQRDEVCEECCVYKTGRTWEQLINKPSPFCN